ncbi:ABC transporter ATP-binding protein [Variovorax sp. RHLX14]|uniref:ABC transporter ATP-binding protein n=1 Tax=Variovorax sp. RHLX14 TaxID=1259731 RepID=UPI003F488ECE
MTALLQVRGLTLSFGAVVVASGYDFDLQADERLAVIGANGAGKTTFINMVTGYIKPAAGTIAFDGRDITGLDPRDIVRLGIGRSFQLPQLFLEHSVRESIELAVAARGRRLGIFRRMSDSVSRAEIDHTLEVVGLSARAGDLCGSLPEGHRKLLDIAMALVLRPKLLIMDEPTSGVAADEKHPLMATIMNALAERKVTSIFVEHDVDIVERYATRVAAWISGRIAADGPPGVVMNNPEVRSVVLGH